MSSQNSELVKQKKQRVHTGQWTREGGCVTNRKTCGNGIMKTITRGRVVNNRSKRSGAQVDKCYTIRRQTNIGTAKNPKRSENDAKTVKDRCMRRRIQLSSAIDVCQFSSIQKKGNILRWEQTCLPVITLTYVVVPHIVEVW